MADSKKTAAQKVADKKANRRGAARLAAVQALYQMDIAGAGINDIFAEFESHWLGSEVEGDKYLPAEAAFFRDVVVRRGARSGQARSLDRRGAAKGWPLKRIDAILRAVLRAGSYELEHRKDVPAASWCRNMSMSRMPLSTATRPAWSMPCSTRSRGSSAPTSSRGASGMPASGEDSLIARYFRPLATDPGAFGLVDDAAILKAFGDDIVVTTDAIVEGVHFLPDDPPDTIARKALRVNFPISPPRVRCRRASC